MLAFSSLLGFLYVFIYSKLLFKKIEFEYLIITLFILSSPIPILAYTNVWTVKYYFYLSFIFIFIVAIYKIFSKRKNILILLHSEAVLLSIKKYYLRLFDSELLKLVFLSLVSTLLLTYKFFPTIWRFESTELLYFSWLNDINQIDYSGAVRLPTAYPYLQAANHLTPGSLLVPFLFFTKNITLYSSYIVKYILIFLTSYNFLFQYIKTCKERLKQQSIKQIYLPLSIALLGYFFYFPELEYSLSISNFPLIIIIFTLGSFFIKNINIEVEKKKENTNIYLFLPYIAYCYSITKATTFPIIFLTFSIFIFLIGINKIRNFVNNINIQHKILIILMLLINILSWIIPESNHGSLHISFPFCVLDLNQSNLNNCLSSFLKNPFSGWYIKSFKTLIFDFLNIEHPLFEFLYIWLICLLPCLIMGYFLVRNIKDFFVKNLGLFILCYVLSTSICIVFLRESLTFSGAHIAHSYLIAPAFTYISFILIYLNNLENNKTNKKKLFQGTLTTFFLVLLINLDNSRVNLREDALLNKVASDSFNVVSITHKESKQFDELTCPKNQNIKSKFNHLLKSNECGNNELAEINSSLKGLRTNISLFSEKSVVGEWALNP